MNLKWPTGLALCAVAVALAATVALSLTASPEHLNEPAPDVAFTRLDGSTAQISDLKGKVVLVNFWATTCKYCVAEMPKVVETHLKYEQAGFETLAVAMQYDPPFSVVNFAQSRQLPFSVVIDNTGAIARRFGNVRVTPTWVLIDKQGHVVERSEGEPDFAALHARVESLL